MAALVRRCLRTARYERLAAWSYSCDRYHVIVILFMTAVIDRFRVRICIDGRDMSSVPTCAAVYRVLQGLFTDTFTAVLTAISWKVERAAHDGNVALKFEGYAGLKREWAPCTEYCRIVECDISIESKLYTAARECSPKRTSSYRPMQMLLQKMSKEPLGIYVQSRDSGHDIVMGDMRSDRTER